MAAKNQKKSDCCGTCPRGICNPYRMKMIRRLKLEAMGIKLPADKPSKA